MSTRSLIQKLADNSEMENSQNKRHAKLSEFTVAHKFIFPVLMNSFPNPSYDNFNPLKFEFQPVLLIISVEVKIWLSTINHCVPRLIFVVRLK